MRALLLVFIGLLLASAQSLDRQLFEFESQLQKVNISYKKKRSSEEVVYAHKNATLRVQFDKRVYALSAWIVPRREYRDNKQTLDFLSSAVRVFCSASEEELTDFRNRVAYAISHTQSTPLKVGKCHGELRHILEFMNWELVLKVKE